MLGVPNYRHVSKPANRLVTIERKKDKKSKIVEQEFDSSESLGFATSLSLRSCFLGQLTHGWTDKAVPRANN